MNRRDFLRRAALAGSAALLRPTWLPGSDLVTPVSPSPEGITDIGGTKQLFLDDLLIAERSRISNFIYRPDKNPKNPILIADKPWELEGNTGVEQDGQGVMYDPDERLFKMWYLAPAWSNQLSPWCYAVSKDGYVWEKPELAIYDYRGSRRNNILGAWNGGTDMSFTCVTKTPDPDPQARFKAMGEWENGPPANTYGGACIAFSPDGVHWTVENKAVIHHGRNLGDAPTMFGWDPWKKKYVAYPRPGHPLAREINGNGKHRHVRTIGYAESDDFVHWTPTRIMIAPDAEDRVDYQFGQFVAGICGNFYVGFLMVHQTHEQTWGVFLMSSRDGFHWNWVDRHTPFMVRGEVGTYDAGYQDMCGPITHAGKIFIYYTGNSGLHGEEYGRRWGPNQSVIAMATMPEDRWLGLLAGPDQGTIVTQPLTFRGSRLMIDIEASTPQGQSPPGSGPGFDECDVRFALADQSGGSIAGFSSDRSTRILRSGRQEVFWAGTDLGKLAGKPVRLRCEIRNAALYSIQFV